MLDPTFQEMREYLAALPFDDERDAFDIECAIYWYSADYHGGQWTNLYSALSMSEYRPGAMESGPDSVAAILYAALEDEFGGANAKR